MAKKNRVLWKEGLFIKPQHFQQESRFHSESLSESLNIFSDFFFGFKKLEINRSYLTHGKFAISEAFGVMPDGTMFASPSMDSLPAPISIGANSINKKIYLCLPLSIDGTPEITWEKSTAASRSKVINTEIKDAFSESGDYVALDLLGHNLQLKIEGDDIDHYTTLAIARVADISSDGNIILDKKFYPTITSIQAAPQLSEFLTEMAELMRERAKNISNRVVNPSQSGVADVSDFLMLLSLNRAHPVLSHFSKISGCHPERLYESLISICGELSTFIIEDKIPERYQPYNHKEPHLSFLPLENRMRAFLSTVMHAKALSIPIIQHEYGVYTAQVNDKSLFNEAEFILAIKASVPTDILRSQFSQQIKISSIEKISELVSLQLPGISLSSLPVAPRHLPYHSGFIYFQLDKANTSWQVINDSSGFGVHLAGNYPDLEMEFWAIRGN